MKMPSHNNEEGCEIQDNQQNLEQQALFKQNQEEFNDDWVLEFSEDEEGQIEAKSNSKMKLDNELEELTDEMSELHSSFDDAISSSSDDEDVSPNSTGRTSNRRKRSTKLKLPKTNHSNGVEKAHQKKMPCPQRPFKCQKCEKGYKNESGLRNHLKYECGIEPRFACSLCDYRASRNAYLRKHLFHYHKITEPSQLAKYDAGPKQQPVKPFLCDICGKRYSTKPCLRVHLSKRCGKNPSFPCTLCKYHSARKGGLKRHLMEVHDVRAPSQLAAHGMCHPFQCDLCSFSSAQNATLQKHVAMKHSGDK